uniref:Peptidase S1 domain-containing protein n=1 Tax=Biomphalaria glabrata TaxID=6526 RepID=A0A2C9M3F4_BIOGL
MGSMISIDKDKMHFNKKDCRDLNLTGRHECLISEAGEADLFNQLIGCKKNPNHTQFVSIETLTVEDLPEGYRDAEFYELIRGVADLTVKVDVKMTSCHRPNIWPGKDVPYPFCDYKGKTYLRCGSGLLMVYMFRDGIGLTEDGVTYEDLRLNYNRCYKTCPCEKCLLSDDPSTVWWEFIVGTAAHVVFDDCEASSTKCTVFSGEGAEEIDLSRFVVDYVKEDTANLKYVTCDESLGKTFHAMQRNLDTLWKEVWTKYESFDDKLVFVVSHPHECSKHVSFGHWIDNTEIAEFNKTISITQMTYTAATCPGSSGAPVFNVSCPSGHAHSGFMTSENLNFSAIGLYTKKCNAI